MYVNRVCLRLFGALVIAGWAGTAAAQSATQSAAPPVAAASAMNREGSGTSWLPDVSPMYALHRLAGRWMLMAHENAFLEFLHESGTRGSDQAGSINWVMGMAQRTVGRGRLVLRGMFSIEPWTIRGCGYPDLLASGEQCHGEAIHDRQHPHDFPMEIAAQYDAPLTAAIRWQVYAGPAGEPALGPVAFAHRPSSMPNPLAPITHHWLDATHISFGVITGGLYATRWKVETSAFNGREPDDRRADFDFGRLDSVSGRVWFLPRRSLAFQLSAGRVTEAEAPEGSGPRRDITRITASGTYQAAPLANSSWATTIAWGRNEEPGHASNALLAETSLTLDDRDAWFGRFEVVGKTAHDLAVDATAEAFTIAKLQGGYARYLAASHGFKPGLGASISAGFVPAALSTTYGSRVNLGFGVFVTLRPAMMGGSGDAVRSSDPRGSTMVMVPTALDPARLECSPPIEPGAAAQATYQGRTYYFCSPAERDRFLTDPAMSLLMMPPKE